MDKRGAKAGEDAASLFRDAVKDVHPMHKRKSVAPPKPRPAPVPRQRLRDEAQVMKDSLSEAFTADSALDVGEGLAYLRDGIPRQTLRKLRAGQWSIQDRLDLHSLRTEEARPLLASFLSGCVRRGLRCVTIIHGKGMRSPNGQPVLKGRVAGWLVQRDEVLAYIEAGPADGGSGAVIVLLKAGKRPASARDSGI
ncbi:MAG: DNA mismatch repair protein MutS [Betaproteobacteria bacterium]|nr:DNA mismatch repair protein MutS [Betaproteobacteria bacterium]